MSNKYQVQQQNKLGDKDCNINIKSGVGVDTSANNNTVAIRRLNSILTQQKKNYSSLRHIFVSIFVTGVQRRL